MGGSVMEMIRRRQQGAVPTTPAFDLQSVYQPLPRLQGAFSQQPQTFRLPQLLGQQGMAPVNYGQAGPATLDQLLANLPKA